MDISLDPRLGAFGIPLSSWLYTIKFWLIVRISLPCARANLALHLMDTQMECLRVRGLMYSESVSIDTVHFPIIW